MNKIRQQKKNKSNKWKEFKEPPTPTNKLKFSL